MDNDSILMELPVFGENYSFSILTWGTGSLGLPFTLNEIRSKITLNLAGVKFVQGCVNPFFHF